MIDALKKFELIVTGVLIVMLAVVIILALIDLGWILIRDIAAWHSSVSALLILALVAGYFVVSTKCLEVRRSRTKPDSLEK